MDLTPRQLKILQILANHQRQGWATPKAKQLASMLGVHWQNAIVVCFILRELQTEGLINGAPTNGSQSTVQVRVTAYGFRVVDAESQGQPIGSIERPAEVRAVRVRQLKWRCVDCNAVTLNVSKPCVICPLLAAPLAVGFTRTGYEALEQGGQDFAERARVAGGGGHV